MTAESGALYHRWIEQMWNGKTDLAHDLVAESFIGHWPDHDVHGAQGLIDAMTQMHDMFASITFEIEVGPIAEGDLVAGRWRGHGTTPEGESMAFVGNDMLRVGDGRFIEYWVATHPV
ncbi:MAG: ester cyclase [Ornithinimicrobium sp.]